MTILSTAFPARISSVSPRQKTDRKPRTLKIQSQQWTAPPPLDQSNVGTVLVQIAAQEPIAFISGMISGFLALDISKQNENAPLRQWLLEQQGMLPDQQ